MFVAMLEGKCEMAKSLKLKAELLVVPIVLTEFGSARAVTPVSAGGMSHRSWYVPRAAPGLTFASVCTLFYSIVHTAAKVVYVCLP